VLFHTVILRSQILQNLTKSALIISLSYLNSFLVHNTSGRSLSCFKTLPEVAFIVSEPYRKYTIWCRAFNLKNEGNSSTPIQVMSDVAGPGILLLHENIVLVYINNKIT
jgi:hypothetical protein